ncbi:MAG: aminoacyl-tRNA hydrolase [Gammaproteobacteria bacterium]
MADHEAIRLIVGLGNPGAEYASTRHNAGFWFADELARRHGGLFKPERKFSGDLAVTRVDGREVRLFKPMTFMNRSGVAVRAVAAYLKIPPEGILIAHDDLDLPPGTARLKLGGGHGGHNGLRDAMAQLGPGFWRLRLGIGHPGHRAEVIDYVLSRPSREDETLILESVDAAADVMPVLLVKGDQHAMNRLHRRGADVAADDGGTGD